MTDPLLSALIAAAGFIAFGLAVLAVAAAALQPVIAPETGPPRRRNRAAKQHSSTSADQRGRRPVSIDLYA